MELTARKSKAISIDLIQIDRGTQFRETINESKVAEYAEMLSDDPRSWPFSSSCDVFFDGTEYYLVDGFHRFAAANRVGRASINCNVHNGTLRDAIRFALSANARHGLHRSNADKRKAVMFVLEDQEWRTLSSRAIAELCGVSGMFVNNLRESGVNGLHLMAEETPEQRTGKDGKSYPATKPRSQPKEDVEYEDVDEREPGEDEETPEETEEYAKPVTLRIMDNTKYHREIHANICEALRLLAAVPAVPGTEMLIARSLVIKRELDHAKDSIMSTKPHVICPRCKVAGCAQCGNLGWVNSAMAKELG